MSCKFVHSKRKNRSGKSEFEDKLPLFRKTVAMFSRNQLNLTSKQMARFFSKVHNLSYPSKKQMKRIKKITGLTSKKPAYDANVKYENAKRWKTEDNEVYGRTNGQILELAMKHNWPIYNSDETSVPLLRFNENTRTLCLEDDNPQKQSRHASRVTLLGTFSNDDDIQPPVIVTSKQRVS